MIELYVWRGFGATDNPYALLYLSIFNQNRALGIYNDSWGYRIQIKSPCKYILHTYKGKYNL